MSTRRQIAALKEQFLELFAEYGNVVRCAREMGIDRTLIYRWQQRDPTFKENCDEAAEAAILHLEDVAYHRAVEGVERGVYHKGRRVDTELEYSDGLLTLLLKAGNPRKFRDNSTVDVTGLNTTINVGIDLKVLTIDQLKAAREIALALESQNREAEG